MAEELTNTSFLLIHYKFKTQAYIVSNLFFVVVVVVLVLPVYCYQLISLHPHARMLSLVTPWTAAHQVPLSMDFSRQEYWSGLPFPSPASKLFYSYGYQMFEQHLIFKCLIMYGLILPFLSDIIFLYLNYSLLPSSPPFHPTRLPCLWNSPSKNTGVGSHFLLQGLFPTQGLKSK